MLCCAGTSCYSLYSIGYIRRRGGDNDGAKRKERRKRIMKIEDNKNNKSQ